jgi:hypothetical protein
LTRVSVSTVWIDGRNRLIVAERGFARATDLGKFERVEPSSSGGFVMNYAVGILLGAVAVVAFFLMRR